jgi:hypothetical protein
MYYEIKYIINQLIVIISILIKFNLELKVHALKVHTYSNNREEKVTDVL